MENIALALTVTVILWAVVELSALIFRGIEALIERIKMSKSNKNKVKTAEK